MKPRIRIAAVIALVAVPAGGYGIHTWWDAAERKAILEASLAAAGSFPDLSAWPEILQQRHASCVERIRGGSDPVAALEELSRLYHANGFYAEAVSCYYSLEKLQPDNPLWLHRHAAILAGFGEADEALPLWHRAADLAPDYAPIHLRLADLLFKSNRLDEAAAVYARVLEREPGEPHAELGLARCDFEAGRWEAARVRLERLVAQTNFRLGYDLIVTVYERMGMPERAEAIRGQAQASGAYRDPQDPWIDRLLDDCYDPFRLSLAAGALADAGDTTAAIRRLEQALALSPENHALHFQMAGIYLQSGSYSQAREHLLRCTSIAPEFPDGWAQLSQLYSTVGDGAAAERTLAEGLAHCPGSPGLHLAHARRLREAGDIENAIAEYRTSIRLRPNEAGAYVELATLLIGEDRIDEGREELQRALIAEPDHPVALGILAYDAIARGDETAAQQWLRRVAKQPRVRAERRSTLLEAFQQKFGHRFE